MERGILDTSYFSSDRNECHVQLVLGWILRLECLGSSLTSSHADRSIRVLVHADQPPSDSCSVASHGPLAMPLPPAEKGRDAGRGPTRKAAASTVEEKQRKGKEKRRKKKENDPNCRRRTGRCSSDVDVRGRTKAKHEWKIPCDAHPIREGRKTSVQARRARGNRRRWHV